jgi:hypothetical protein
VRIAVIETSFGGGAWRNRLGFLDTPSLTSAELHICIDQLYVFV